MQSRRDSFLAGLMLVGFCSALAVADPSPPFVPDDQLTPGVIASSNMVEVCGTQGGHTYSQAHRHTSEALKQHVRRAYFAKYGTYVIGELDHRLPLSLGGADSEANLWPQPRDGAWNYQRKDALEDELWRRVCRARSMSLQNAQALLIGADWRHSYCQIMGGQLCQKH